MATAAGFDASATSARVKHLRDDDYETYEAGQSDGQSAGDVVVGWGSVVRARVASLASLRSIHERRLDLPPLLRRTRCPTAT